MKVYVIKFSNGTYKGLETRLQLKGYYAPIYKTVPTIEDAQNYASASVANTSMRSVVKRVNAAHAQTVTDIACFTINNHGQYNTRKMNRITEAKTLLDGGYVLESVDVDDRDETNLRCVARKRTKWRNVTKYEFRVLTGGRSYCKSCGMILKNIPAIEHYSMYSFRVCPFCAKAIGALGEQALAGLDPLVRENLEKDIFIHNLGEQSIQK